MRSVKENVILKDEIENIAAFDDSKGNERLMRLSPLPEADWDDQVRLSLRGMLPRERQNPEGAGPALSTLVNHPELTRDFLIFSTRMLYRNSLPPRLRELAILRVATRRNCAYEKTHHIIIAQEEAGLTPTEIESAMRGEALVEPDITVLRAVEELEVDSIVSDETWAALSEYFDKRQLMDFVFTVGCYGLMAMAFNSFGIEPDHESE